MADLRTETDPGSRGRTRSIARAGSAAVVLVVLGLGLWAVYRLTAGTEQHSYAKGVAPAYVQVVKGDTYSISIRGGITTESELGVSPARLNCSVTNTGAQTTAIPVTAEQAGTKELNQIARFIAPYSGNVHVGCVGLPAVFVDDAADASPDWSGLWLVLACACLAVGLPLALSVTRRVLAVSRDDDEVE